MKNALRNFSFIFLTVIIIFAFSFGRASASSPATVIKNAADTVVIRVQDLINYLIKQKWYIFDNYTDPNNYPTLTVPADVDKLISSTTNSNIPRTTSNSPIPVTTSTIPKITKASGYGSNSPILTLTNNERVVASLNPLTSNAVLDTVAGERADDLFANQYFAHASPDGKSVTDLVRGAGYEYLLIGENLALGNFSGDQGIMSAWMASPEHKENILNPRYTELGVSVKTGLYQGQTDTIAVQVFGQPQAGNCPKPDLTSKAFVDSSTVSVKQMQTQALTMYNNLHTIKNSANLDQSYYSQKVQEYNYYAKKTNDAISALKILIDAYNVQVAKYNACLNS